jgi:UDP-4-amino-4,6-dideoxy-N-acetyl-beta-L-altrosamine transaminase
MNKKFIPYGLHHIDVDDIAVVVEALKSDWITSGPKIKEFEGALCLHLGCKYGIAVNSGTSALDIAVASLGLPEGSEIITTPFTFVATSNAIVYNNHRPVFADIEPDTFNIKPGEIRKKITHKTRAIIYVDFGGHPCEIDEIRKIADENDLYLIEDACHALGAEYKGKKIGTFADVTVFSFHPVKHITTGEGGMAVTNNEELEEKMWLLRNHGIDKDAKNRFGSNSGYAYDMKVLGRNYRITDFQAALGISQLAKLDGFVEKRTRLAEGYNELLSEVDFLRLPSVKDGVKHAWHLYTVLVEGFKRDKFFRYLRDSQVGVNVHYIPVYHHSYYSRFNVRAENFHVTEEVFSKIITLPLFPEMGIDKLEYITKKIKDFSG